MRLAKSPVAPNNTKVVASIFIFPSCSYILTYFAINKVQKTGFQDQEDGTILESEERSVGNKLREHRSFR
ncbi:hypothetical protein J40TS1_16150 [Paenibacillus montaniterrae]|uniref:Transmembrane protein n=1 Tax=Paenibacillus montaniterrae TaxID=429341 RepID=A0A919YLA6_9BACL|nr:hypothetical protein J40TS1_16150 [Paenibacillus montaniterrae]